MVYAGRTGWSVPVTANHGRNLVSAAKKLVLSYRNLHAQVRHQTATPSVGEPNPPSINSEPESDAGRWSAKSQELGRDLKGAKYGDMRRVAENPNSWQDYIDSWEAR